MGFVADFLGFDDGSNQVAAANAQAGASVASTQISADVARENIALQREGLAIAKEGVAVAQREVEFNREQYNDWKSVYGDLQENLGAYYNALGADQITAQGLQAEQQEFQNARAGLSRTLAQRGIKGSGVDAAAQTALQSTHLLARADIRGTAEQKAAEQKLGFLGVGLGQGANLLGVTAQSAGQAQGAFANTNAAFGQVGAAYGQVGAAYNQGAANLANLSMNNTRVGGTLAAQRNEFIGDMAGGTAGWLLG